MAAWRAAIRRRPCSITARSNLGRVYGRLFSAWGAAGLTAPLIAGALFDWTGSYTLALAVAAGGGDAGDRRPVDHPAPAPCPKAPDTPDAAPQNAKTQEADGI